MSTKQGTRKKGGPGILKRLLTTGMVAAAHAAGAHAVKPPPFIHTQPTYDGREGTFSGQGGITNPPTYERTPHIPPEPDTSTALSSISQGMMLDPHGRYSVAVKSASNPTFGPLGSIGPLRHHTLEVKQVDESDKPVGHPSYVGYYAKATPTSLSKYNKKYPGRPKLNDHRVASIMSLRGVPGNWQTPDAIVQSGLARGQKLKPEGKPKIVSGNDFNKMIGKSVNLGPKGKYSAIGGALGLGPGNCQTEAADIMDKFGGKRKTRKKRKQKKRCNTKKKIKRKKRKTKKFRN